jgi:hypothetical protein
LSAENWPNWKFLRQAEIFTRKYKNISKVNLPIENNINFEGGVDVVVHRNID